MKRASHSTLFTEDFNSYNTVQEFSAHFKRQRTGIFHSTIAGAMKEQAMKASQGEGMPDKAGNEGQGTIAEAMKGKAMKVSEGEGIVDKAGNEGQGRHAEAMKGKAVKVDEGEVVDNAGNESQGTAEAMKGKAVKVGEGQDILEDMVVKMNLLQVVKLTGMVVKGMAVKVHVILEDRVVKMTLLQV